MNDAFPIVCQLGAELDKRRDGWQKQKALVLLVALAGPWDAAAQLAAALGVPEDLQEAIYRESEEKKQTAAAEVHRIALQHRPRLEVVA